jgi:hypothetical protein
MTNKEFCKIDTAFYGDEIDDIKQIKLRSFDGEELKEYVEAAINYTRSCEKLKNKEADDAYDKGFKDAMVKYRE